MHSPIHEAYCIVDLSRTCWPCR